MWEPGCLQRYSLPFHSYLVFRKGIWKAPAVKGVGLVQWQAQKDPMESHFLGLNLAEPEVVLFIFSKLIFN